MNQRTETDDRSIADHEMFKAMKTRSEKLQLEAPVTKAQERLIAGWERSAKRVCARIGIEFKS